MVAAVRSPYCTIWVHSIENDVRGGAIFLTSKAGDWMGPSVYHSLGL